MTDSRAAYACLVVLGVLAVLPAGGPVRAAAPAVHQVAGPISMDQAVKMAEQRFKARVVRAESQQSGDHTIYVLRLLNDSGRVWTVRVDAASGSVL
jgi:uncharacterized membrane protein YkoI